MSYTADSIQVKDFRSACRAMPGMYIGTDGQDAAFNCFLEVLNNACDEAIMKRGNEIIIQLSDDCNTITCKDSGAGVPHGKNKDCDEVLIELFTSAHSSGKFDDTNYKKVRGMHGIGTSAVCVCSTSFEVWTRREGSEYYISFKDGIPQMQTAKFIRKTNETGSTFKFTPDKQIFRIEGPSFDYERIRQELELTSYFIPNVSFILEHKGNKVKYISKNGLKDFAKDKIQNPLHKSYIYGYKQFDDEVEVEVFAQWTNGKETRYIFSNGALNSDGGTPETGAKTAFTKTINSLSKGNFDADMIRKGLVYIVNIRHPHPIYQNQTKNKIQNTELRGYTQTVFTEAIKNFVNIHNDEFNKIIELLKRDQKAEAAADKARAKILQASNEIEKNQKKKVFASDKLKDAEFLGQDSILLIVEGNSAASSIVKARDYTKYGVLAIRGKIINPLNNNEEDVFENEEIKLLLSAMNIIPGKYDSRKLRYGKIGICVDADSDGYHIALLIMAVLQYLAPQFIQEDRLCWLRSPLYIVKNGKQEQYFFTDEDFDKVRKTIRGEINRAKGLGALSVEQAHNSMFTENYQRLDILHPTENAIQLLYNLMGSDSSLRKEFIFNNVDFSQLRE